MQDFKIKRGLSTTMFSAPGVINPRLLIEEGCWYLCTDTAGLYLGVKDETGKLTLKRINRDSLSGSDSEVNALLDALNSRLEELETEALFKRIESESDLPTDFESEDFNPNVTYYVVVAAGRINTYIFDITSQSYYCTSNINELIIQTMVSDAIDIVLADRFEKVLPEAIKQVISTTVLHGGDANPEDD